MTKNDDKRIPALRFKGFNDDWAQRKLKDLTDVRDGTHSSPKYVEAGHPFITSKNINNGSIDYRDIKYITDEDFDEINKRSKVDIHDILMGMIGTVGNLALIDKKPNFAIKNIALIKDIGKIDYLFLYNFLQSNYVSKELIQKLDGGTQKFISLNKVRDLNISVASFQEQKAISKCLMRVNNLLILQQRKEKLLKQIQQAIYYNIYPEYGTKIPIIRHREFNKDWSIVSFNKLYKKSKEKNDLTYGEDKIISVAKMYFKHESQNSSKDYLKTYNVFKKGDIAFEGNRSEGFSHGRFVQNNIGDGIVSHVFDVFTPLKKENLNYWKYAIHNEHIMKYILVKSTTKATMMNNLSTKDFLKQKIAVPNSREMKKISHLLKRLDDQLEFSKRKIKLLTKVKQFLLQNMFI